MYALTLDSSYPLSTKPFFNDSLTDEQSLFDFVYIQPQKLTVHMWICWICGCVHMYDVLILWNAADNTTYIAVVGG